MTDWFNSACSRLINISNYHLGTLVLASLFTFCQNTFSASVLLHILGFILNRHGAAPNVCIVFTQFIGFFVLEELVSATSNDGVLIIMFC